jgi:ribulose bisphosphate carboxylase small subunit
MNFKTIKDVIKLLEEFDSENTKKFILMTLLDSKAGSMIRKF